MLLAEVVSTSSAIAATRARSTKIELLAALLTRAAAGSGEELPIVTSYAGGSLRQRRTGVGWRSLADLPEPATSASLTVDEVDATCAALAELAGPGSASARADAVRALFGRASAEEQTWLRGLLLGEVRQGALDSLVQEALARASGAAVADVRRAAMLAGSTVAIAALAFSGDLDSVGLRVGVPISPMLASSAPTIAAGVERLGPCVIEAKLDGIRVQVHRSGDDVRVFTRSLDEITTRLPEVVELVAELPVDAVILDGEVLLLDSEGRPRPFQETASRTSQGEGAVVTPRFFDLMHLDGRDLIDEPASERWRVLSGLLPSAVVQRAEVTGAAEATAFYESVVAAGHEGVVLKSPEARYDAGRRGAAWVKVKPVHTVDLVVLAVEWGSGRRSGLLSNIHLGARSSSGPVMVGKTFKGMTDQMLAWQTERFLELETERAEHVVRLRPEQVVEIAFDGVQRSTRYPGGVALRFARVVRYRDDKTADQADTIEHLRELL